jgi:hypothetical protein
MTTLRSFIKGIAVKYLSAVDATPTSSNQHEIGSNKFSAILGEPGASKVPFDATFLFFNSESDEPERSQGLVTWYDTRLAQKNRSSEYRLYYRKNSVTEQFREGDFCLVGMQTSGSLLIVIARPDSPEEYRLRHLFSLDTPDKHWQVESAIKDARITLATRQILEALGIEPPIEPTIDIDLLLAKYDKKFPTTKEFSALARKCLPRTVSPIDDPDDALEAWMEHEEMLFRALERSIVQERLHVPFTEVDEFISFSLSVQNRRKSRVGHALENHLSAVFDSNSIRYERGVRTENNSKPDFLFPGANQYHDPAIGSPPLRMLGAKTSCKDRWRQVLTEAAKIPEKHLFTLETALSQNQLNEMFSHSLCLVSTPTVLATYSNAGSGFAINLREFIAVVSL